MEHVEQVMQKAYEEVIRRIESLEVSVETDRLLQRLGEESMARTPGRPAFRAAVDYLVRRPALDPSPLGRLRRLSHLFVWEREEVEEQIDRFISLFMTELRRSMN